MKFKYNGKLYNPVNIEKKLKKLGITFNDIEIIEEEKKIDNELDDFYEDKEQVIIHSTLDDIKRVCYVPKGTRPPIKDILKNHIWNPETKTGVYPEPFINTMYYVI